MQPRFECTIKVKRENDNGKVVNANDLYIVDALSFIEAETRLSEELEKAGVVNFTLRKVQRSLIIEIIDDYNGEFWFKVRVSYIGDKKNTHEYALVSADTPNAALEIMQERLKAVVTAFRVTQVTEIDVADIFYAKPLEEA